MFAFLLMVLPYAASWPYTGQPRKGDAFPEGLNPLCLLTLGSLSQAWPLGSLRLPHQHLSGAALSPPVCIRRQLRPNDSVPACTGPGGTGLLPSLIPEPRFVTHVVEALLVLGLLELVVRRPAVVDHGAVVVEAQDGLGHGTAAARVDDVSGGLWYL